MPLITLLDAQLAYGDFPLLDRAAFSLEAGERIGLIGRNGTGKSSLLAVIAGSAALDDGELRKSESTRVAFVEQEPKLPHAPSLRAISDLADPQASLFIHPGGQSGNPLSPHYRSFASAWARGEYAPMVTDRSRLEARGVQRLVLTPRK